MKITKRQLRRIIAEATRETIVEQVSARTDGRAPEIENSIMRTLTDQPGIGGMELADQVMSDVAGVERNSVFDFLDVLLEDGVVFFDVEEDEWRLR